jgi:magnesium-transporting ATPase (P-type)
VERPLITGFALWRIVFIGALLVGFTLAVFFAMKAAGAADAPARTAAVNAITIGQVFYLLNSRYLIDSSLSLRAHRGNKYLPYGVLAVVVLQLLFTYAPPFEALFGTAPISWAVWPWLLAGGVVFFLVVEAEKFVIRSLPAVRSAVSAAEAGRRRRNVLLPT